METGCKGNTGYNIFQHKGELKTSEFQLQNYFKSRWKKSKRFTLDCEVNNSRGPVDFKITHRPGDTALIEFKMAKSGSLKKNILFQIPIYEEDNDGAPCLAVIFAFTDGQIDRAKAIISSLPRKRRALTHLMDFRKYPTSASKAGTF